MSPVTKMRDTWTAHYGQLLHIPNKCVPDVVVPYQRAVLFLSEMNVGKVQKAMSHQGHFPRGLNRAS